MNELFKRTLGDRIKERWDRVLIEQHVGYDKMTLRIREIKTCILCVIMQKSCFHMSPIGFFFFFFLKPDIDL